MYKEIVKCKDCTYAHLTADGLCKYCDKIEGEQYFDGDFFCAYGEKKDEVES